MIIHDYVEKCEYRERDEYMYQKDGGMIFRKPIHDNNSKWEFVSVLNDEFRALFS
jgi:hypothetical protein